jgi:uncharacterized membrane protein
MPTWALAASYWLHLIATVIWIGGLALMALVVWPGARAALGPGPQLNALLRQWQKRFTPLAWASLAVLTGTGLFQMAADPNYDGFLMITNAWAAAIVIKHLAVIGMVVIGAYMQFGLQPEIARVVLLQERGRAGGDVDLSPLRRRESMLTWLNLACALITLACTAIATAL